MSDSVQYRSTRYIPSQADIACWFDVDLELGTLRWKHRDGDRLFNKNFAGKIAGTSVTGGYLRVWTSKGTYAVHHIIWFVGTGQWVPSDREIDHKDRDPTNNSLNNLRLATKVQNSANSRVRTANKTGYKGVYKRITCSGRVRYDVALTKNKKKIIIGNYDCVLEAAKAWDKVAKQTFGEFAVLNFPQET